MESFSNDPFLGSTPASYAMQALYELLALDFFHQEMKTALSPQIHDAQLLGGKSRVPHLIMKKPEGVDQK